MAESDTRDDNTSNVKEAMPSEEITPIVFDTPVNQQEEKKEEESKPNFGKYGEHYEVDYYCNDGESGHCTFVAPSAYWYESRKEPCTYFAAIHKGKLMFGPRPSGYVPVTSYAFHIENVDRAKITIHRSRHDYLWKTNQPTIIQLPLKHFNEDDDMKVCPSCSLMNIVKHVDQNVKRPAEDSDAITTTKTSGKKKSPDANKRARKVSPIVDLWDGDNNEPIRDHLVGQNVTSQNPMPTEPYHDEFRSVI